MKGKYHSSPAHSRSVSQDKGVLVRGTPTAMRMGCAQLNCPGCCKCAPVGPGMMLCDCSGCAVRRGTAQGARRANPINSGPCTAHQRGVRGCTSQLAPGCFCPGAADQINAPCTGSQTASGCETRNTDMCNCPGPARAVPARAPVRAPVRAVPARAVPARAVPARAPARAVPARAPIAVGLSPGSRTVRARLHGTGGKVPYPYLTYYLSFGRLLPNGDLTVMGPQGPVTTSVRLHLVYYRLADPPPVPYPSFPAYGPGSVVPPPPAATGWVAEAVYWPNPRPVQRSSPQAAPSYRKAIDVQTSRAVAVNPGLPVQGMPRRASKVIVRRAAPGRVRGEGASGSCGAGEIACGTYAAGGTICCPSGGPAFPNYDPRAARRRIRR